MLNAILVSLPVLTVLALVGLSQLGPSPLRLNSNELATTVDYINRTSRRGTTTHPRFASVVNFQVREKRILYLPGRTT